MAVNVREITSTAQSPKQTYTERRTEDKELI